VNGERHGNVTFAIAVTNAALSTSGCAGDGGIDRRRARLVKA